MKVSTILLQELKTCSTHIHQSRLKTLCAFTESVMKDQRVSVTYLGRGFKKQSKTTKKHDIKRADRLIGNTHLHLDRPSLYEYMADKLIGNQVNPLIIIDWSPINGNEIFQLLRASIPMGGRSLTIYEKTFKESALNTHAAHTQFLNELESILPEGCQPIIMADAIFRAPWFSVVEKKNWYWINRVRGRVSLSQDKETWTTAYQWFTQAKVGKVLPLGSLYYSKGNKHACQGVLFKRTKKGRFKKKMRGGVSNKTMDKTHKKDANEPWLLVYCLPEKIKAQPERVVKSYRQRMQIEENFRDTKNGKLGVALEYSNSKTTLRYDNLLLIAALALFSLWCIGKAAVMKNMQRTLQANTTKHRPVLSIIYIGREVIEDERYEVTLEEYSYVLYNLAHFTISIHCL